MYECTFELIKISYLFYESSLSSREVGGGTHSPGGPSIGGGQLHEGGDMHSPGGQSMGGRVGSKPISGNSCSQ